MKCGKAAKYRMLVFTDETKQISESEAWCLACVHHYGSNAAIGKEYSDD
jgi:hypothetical protein